MTKLKCDESHTNSPGVPFEKTLRPDEAASMKPLVIEKNPHIQGWHRRKDGSLWYGSRNQKPAR